MVNVTRQGRTDAAIWAEANGKTDGAGRPITRKTIGRLPISVLAEWESTLTDELKALYIRQNREEG